MAPPSPSGSTPDVSLFVAIRYIISKITSTISIFGYSFYFNFTVKQSYYVQEHFNEVYVIWCGEGILTFRHYVSIISIAKQLAPFVLHFYCEHLPVEDTHHYYQWFETIKSELPFLTITVKQNICLPTKNSPNLTLMANQLLLRQTHGQAIFDLNKHVFILSRLTSNHRQWNNTRTYSFENNNLSSYLLESRLNSQPNLFECGMLISSDNKLFPVRCDSRQICTCISRDLRPRDLLDSKDNLGINSIIRELLYGTKNVPQPSLNTSFPVPQIAHYVILGKKDVSIVFYFSILSALYIAKVNCVYVHGDVKPEGYLWKDVVTRGCVKWCYRPQITAIWQKSVTNIKHRADVIRADIMFTYGGLHLDPDVLIHQSLPKHYWYYDAVIALDSYSGAPGNDVPEDIAPLISMGFCLSRPGAEFYRLYRESQRNYYDGRWVYNSGIKPLQIFERHPHLALVDSRLQVVCANYRCVPSWVTNKETALSLARQPMTWLHNVTSLHVSWPIPDEFRMPKSLTKSHSVFAYVARKILLASNLTIGHVTSLFHNYRVSV